CGDPRRCRPDRQPGARQGRGPGRPVRRAARGHEPGGESDGRRPMGLRGESGTMKILLVLALALPLVGGAPEDSVVAIKGARVIPVSGPELESTTILIRAGRIEAVGKD